MNGEQIFKSAVMVHRRAGTEIMKVISECDAYLKLQPFEPFEWPIAGSPYKALKFKRAVDTPADLIFSITNSLQYLRACLDHLGYAFATAANPGKRVRKTHFPFAKDKESFDRLGNSGCKDIPGDALKVMQSFGGYAGEGGNRVLYALASIRNVSEHRYIVPQPAAIASFNMSTLVTTEHMVKLLSAYPGGIMSVEAAVESPSEGALVTHFMEPRVLPVPIWDQTDQSLCFAYYDPRMSNRPDVTATIYLSFDDHSGLKGARLEFAILQIHDIVSEIIFAMQDFAASQNYFPNFKSEIIASFLGKGRLQSGDQIA